MTIGFTEQTTCPHCAHGVGLAWSMAGGNLMDGREKWSILHACPVCAGCCVSPEYKGFSTNQGAIFGPTPDHLSCAHGDRATST